MNISLLVFPQSWVGLQPLEFQVYPLAAHALENNKATTIDYHPISFFGLFLRQKRPKNRQRNFNVFGLWPRAYIYICAMRMGYQRKAMFLNSSQCFSIFFIFVRFIIFLQLSSICSTFVKHSQILRIHGHLAKHLRSKMHIMKVRFSLV